ncbi:hypothetical protein F7725_022491 [Dissostichus mawsoni]|uniref:N-lysine methyltransferase SETD6 n=1 Tax=Dissostichus mawsoni TaxID=36200 RepID=A0A7J5YYF3_DISMA|nr:hypothetical protein F7725_022491 [Dissostichus mawsoni]
MNYINTMATGAKRPKVDYGSEMNPLQNFLQWCNTVGLRLSHKVCVSKEGTVAEYGMLAKDNIEEGEVLFTIPRSAVLHQETTKVSAVLEKEKSSLESSSGWVPLLLALLYEYTSSQSQWKPYLSLWANFKTLDHPMFWSKEERDGLLRGTGIPEAVETDLANIQREYTNVVLPFIRKHPDLWNPGTHTLELYTQLVAFVMAYRLDSLKMVCVRPIHKGEEVFNTYGQLANWQLLHMYGFTEPHQSNSNDTVDIPIINLYKVATQGVQSDLARQLVEEKWEMLLELMQEKATFVFGNQGCLTDTELHSVLKVLCMSEEEFSEFKDHEGWEEDEEDEISLAFSYEGLPGLNASWKWLIHEAARLTASSYGDWEEGGSAPEGLSSRQQRALQVRCGQRSILHRLMELTKS